MVLPSGILRFSFWMENVDPSGMAALGMARDPARARSLSVLQTSIRSMRAMASLPWIIGDVG